MNVKDCATRLVRFERIESERATRAIALAGRAFVIRAGRIAVDATSRQPLLLRDVITTASRPLPFLGIDECGAPLYTLVLDDAAEIGALFDAGVDPGTIRFDDPRMELGRYGAADREAVVTALALARWSHAERFCGRCGTELVWEVGGRTKRCTRENDPHRHFPRTDPATIVLVHDGERVLLGRQAVWPAGLYSTLAGFVEAGENAENSVAREVFEEVGVRVDDVRYVASEPWPFPRSLMLGFTARARTFDVRIGDELEDARWFSRAELATLHATTTATMPYFDTIARRLMAGWLGL